MGSDWWCPLLPNKIFLCERKRERPFASRFFYLLSVFFIRLYSFRHDSRPEMRILFLNFISRVFTKVPLKTFDYKYLRRVDSTQINIQGNI